MSAKNIPSMLQLITQLITQHNWLYDSAKLIGYAT